MARKKNPSGDGLMLVAAAGAGVYLFWPQLQQLLGLGTPAATSATATIPGQPTISPVNLNPRPAGTIAPYPIANPSQYYVEDAQGNLTLTNAASAQPVGNDHILCDTPDCQQGPASLIANPLQARPLPPRIALMRGISNAAIAVTKLNQMRADAGPQVTNNSPIGPWTPGAEQLPGGCYRYGNTPVLVNCPPGTAPPPPRAPAHGRCAPGYTMDSAGVCARQADQVMLAQLNSTPFAPGIPISWGGLSPSIVGVYVSTLGVQPGTQLAALLNLPANPTSGVLEQGNDGFNYLPVQGTYIRQGTATQLSRPTGPIGPRIKLQGLRAIAQALPITNATLIAASNDPDIAAMVGNDPRAMLTVSQWNYFYTQATGIQQGTPKFPHIEPHALISAAEYQAWRRFATQGHGVRASAGLENSQKLGLIRNSRPGAFPLGGISDGPDRQAFVHPGNQNVYRIPGRSSLRLGIIQSGGGDHRYARSPFPRAAGWRRAE